MKALEVAVEWLRPLVRAQKWDYCVIWKLGDDPSRYIEWLDCCCGGVNESSNIKEEVDELTPLCRDTCLKHPVRTKACEALSQLPLFMPLYSGIHTEVVISTQPRWISQVDIMKANTSNVDSVGTQVLIPVMGGLIELYAVKHIPKNQSTLELILSHYNLCLEREMMSASCGINVSQNDLLDALPEEIQKCSRSLHLLALDPKLQVFPSVTQPRSRSSTEGSSTGFNSKCGLPSKQSEKSSGSKNPKCKEILVKKQRKERENHHSKNLVTERNRRNRIKDGLFTLRALVPKITKMDRASILGDAIEFIEELQKKEKELLEELRILEEEDRRKRKADTKISPSNSEKRCSIYMPGSSTLCSDIRTEVEINQIGKKNCFIKLFCKEKRGGFVRLMEAIDSLGLTVVNANVTTFHGTIQNILEVEANEDIQAQNLKDSLIKLTG